MTDEQLLAAFDSIKTEIHRSNQALRTEMHESNQALRTEMNGLKDEMILVSRNMQTEVIRYMGNLAEQFNIRMRHVEANAGNMETAERLRLASLEERMLRIEKKVLGNEN